MKLSHRRKRNHKAKIRRHAWKLKQTRSYRRKQFVELNPVVKVDSHRADEVFLPARRLGEALVNIGHDARRKIGGLITKPQFRTWLGVNEIESFPISESDSLKRERLQKFTPVRFNIHVNTSGFDNLSDEQVAEAWSKLRQALIAEEVREPNRRFFSRVKDRVVGLISHYSCNKLRM